MRGIWIARNLALFAPYALCRAVARFLLACPIELYEHGIVDVRAESSLHSIQVNLVAVRGQLDAIGEPFSQVMNETVGRLRIPLAYVPGYGKLGVGINGRPGPNVPKAELTFQPLGDVLFFGVSEGPDFIALDAAGFHAPNRAVMKVKAGLPDFRQELQDRALAVAGHAAGCPDGIAFYQSPDDPCFLFNA